MKEVVEKYTVLKKCKFIEFNERDYRMQNRRKGKMTTTTKHSPTHLHTILEHKDKEKILKSSMTNKQQQQEQVPYKGRGVKLQLDISLGCGHILWMLEDNGFQKL